MRTIALILLVNCLLIVLAESSTQQQVEKVKNVGCDRLGNFEERFANLAESIASNFTALSERIAKLKKLIETLTMSQESLNKGIISDASTVCNNSNQHGPIITSCKVPSTSGVFRMHNPNAQVFCEMDSFNGGWLVIQQRVDRALDFNRSWAEYRDGFGTVDKNGSFWLSLEAVHQITSRGSCELAVEMKDGSGRYQYARYSQFGVAGEDDKYRLTVGGYSDSERAGDMLSHHNGMKFSTFDDNNDPGDIKCAQRFGGWWFKKCFLCNLNYPDGGTWHPFTNEEFILSYTRMMIRCE
ncbi:ficolin-1 [Culex quinquefasciatus]|uniref:ficolin-1 n=1 Tax=Culex quinquefasciatus TaxID=7176 RepID=UPI0018E3AF0E|nr:ficolin-1 [Culex quinquefasciatus]